MQFSIGCNNSEKQNSSSAKAIFNKQKNLRPLLQKKLHTFSIKTLKTKVCVRYSRFLQQFLTCLQRPSRIGKIASGKTVQLNQTLLFYSLSSSSFFLYLVLFRCCFCLSSVFPEMKFLFIFNVDSKIIFISKFLHFNHDNSILL